MSSPGPGRRCWAARRQHGMLVLSPRAVERLESYTPPWPLPKLFRLTKGGKLIEGVFKGETINTPSMLASRTPSTAALGRGASAASPALIGRSQANLRRCGLGRRHRWVDSWPEEPATRSNTSVCLKIVDPGSSAAAGRGRAARGAKRMVALLEAEGVAFDIGGYRDAPPGLRIWGGATVEPVRHGGAAALARLGLRHRQGGHVRLIPRSYNPHSGVPPRCPCRPAPLIRADGGDDHAEGADFRQDEPERRRDLPRPRHRGGRQARPDARRAEGRASANTTASPSARPPR
jgi:hypothetical protein